MNMRKENVFLDDVDVPEVVREKMDDAFLIIKTERKKEMKKDAGKRTNKKDAGKWKAAGILAATAACVATVIVVIAAKGGWKSGNPEGTTMLVENGGDTGEMSVTEETFTLNIMGAELEKDKPVQLVSNDSLITEKYAGSWILEGMEGGGVSYCINVPFTCQGNLIKNITYSINNGAFQIVQPKGDSIIIDGQLCEGELNTGIIGGHSDESGEETQEPVLETVFYKSFTLDYQRQSDENTWVNICNERPDNGELESMIFGDNTLENKNLGMQKMLDNTVITCTVNYADGTSQSVDVFVNSCIMTCAEAGTEVKDDPNREGIFITFELK